MSFHRDSSGDDNHIPHFREYADDASRTTDTTVTEEHIGKWARQLDNNTWWVLLTTTPAWDQIAGTTISGLPFAAITDPDIDAAVQTATIDANQGTVITTTTTGNSQTLQAPTDTTAGKPFVVINNDTSSDPISINGTNLSVGESISFVWDGTAWAATAAGGGGSALSVEDEGVEQEAATDTINFTGTGVAATGAAGTVTVDVPGNVPLSIEDEGSEQQADTDTIDFIGPGVTVTGAGGKASVTIPGNLPLAIADEGVTVESIAQSIDFVGPKVAATSSAGAATVTVGLPFVAATDPAVDAAVTTAIIDVSEGTVITTTAAGNAQTLSAPTNTTPGRLFVVSSNDVSSDTITINGRVLAAGNFLEFYWDGTAWVTSPAAGSPAGADGEIQFNASGSHGASANLSWDDTNNVEKVLGDIEQTGGEAGNLYLPTVVSTTVTGTNPRFAVAQGNYLYVVDSGSDDLRIFDVTDPAAPVLVNATPLVIGNCRGCDIAGRFLFVSDTGSGGRIVAIDVIDKSNPVIVGSVVVDGSPRGIKVQGNTAFIANNELALAFQTVDVSDPENLILLSTLPLSSAARAELDVVGDIAYVASVGPDVTFQTIDISDPSNPVVIDEIDVASDTWAVAVQGRYAYVVTESDNDLKIFDVSDPSAITLISTVVLTGSSISPRAVRVTGNFAYVIEAQLGEFYVVDISDPTNPVLISTALDTGSNPVSLTLVGRFAYILDNSLDSFKVIDVGGIEAQNLNVGNIDAGQINLRRDLKMGGVISTTGVVVGSAGIASAGLITSQGRPMAGASQNVVEIYIEDDFNDLATGTSISGGHILLQPGVTYDVKRPLTITNQIDPPTVSGVFLPAVIRTSSKYANIVSIDLTGIPLIDVTNHQGQLTFENIRLENIGTGSFAQVSGIDQQALLIELRRADLVGFAPGTQFTQMLFLATDESFWGDSGTFKFIDCEIRASRHFTVNIFADNGDSSFDIASSAGSVVTSIVKVLNSALSGNANEAFFMLHSNLIAGSTIRIDGTDFDPFTPGVGSFFATLSGTITGLQDSTGAPGVRTVCLSVGHNVADGDTIIHTGFTTETQLNGTFIASDVTTDQYEVVAAFSGTDTGTWSNVSLDQKDVKVNARQNEGIPDSKTIGSVYVVGNATETIIAAQSVFADLDLGTAIEASNIELWSLTDTETGELTYNGISDFSGILFAGISAVSSGGSQEFHFRAVKNGSVLTDAIETILDIGSAPASASLVVPISVSTGDTVRLQVENVDGTTNITVSHVSVSIQ